MDVCFLSPMSAALKVNESSHNTDRVRRARPAPAGKILKLEALTGGGANLGSPARGKQSSAPPGYSTKGILVISTVGIALGVSAGYGYLYPVELQGSGAYQVQPKLSRSGYTRPTEGTSRAIEDSRPERGVLVRSDSAIDQVRVPSKMPEQQRTEGRLATFSVPSRGATEARRFNVASSGITSSNLTSSHVVSSSVVSNKMVPSLPKSSSQLVSRVYSIVKKYAPKHTYPAVLAEAIVRESLHQGYDPLFVAAVIKSESAFNASARSNKGAQGLMQIMPATGAWLAKQERLPRGSLTMPGRNLKLGIKYLKSLEEDYEGNRVFTLVAYNWGPGHLERAHDGRRRVPAECLSYAVRILNDYRRWRSGIL